MEIKWIKSTDSFVISRDELADLTDWAENIYRNHSRNYDNEDIESLRELLNKINKAMLKYIKDTKVKPKRLKIVC